jgi:hypothetical protein
VTAALQQMTARQRLTAIRNALALADDLLAQAYAARDWAALGHASWEAYCAAEIPELRHLKLRAPERRARIQTLRNAAPGISVRELAAATGASVGTVHGDLAAPRPAEPAAGAPGSTVARVLLAVLDRKRPAGARVHLAAAADRLSCPPAAGRSMPRMTCQAARRHRPDRLYPAEPRHRRHRRLPPLDFSPLTAKGPPIGESAGPSGCPVTDLPSTTRSGDALPDGADGLGGGAQHHRVGRGEPVAVGDQHQGQGVLQIRHPGGGADVGGADPGRGLDMSGNQSVLTAASQCRL